jgi:D-3-phosphoglycerate dehydrogenase
MSQFKVVLMDRDLDTVPAWVKQKLAEHDIAFDARKCASMDQVAECAADADVVWNWGSYTITPEGMARLPQCGALIRTGSGTDNVPVEEATRRGIVVANTPEAHNDAVSDHAIGLLLAVIRGIPAHDRKVRANEWKHAHGRRHWHLRGQTLGLVGFGLIARLVAKKMGGWDMTILDYDPFVSAEVMARQGVHAASLDELLTKSDFVLLHCPLTKETYHLIGERELRLMKPSAVLINTARGPVVDEPALVRALTEGWIAAAGLDVLEDEPPAADNPLLKLENTVITPHAAGFSDEDEQLCWQLSVDSAIAFKEGRWPRSYVNRSVQPRLKLA